MCLWSVEIGFLWRGKKKEPRKWIDAINLTMAVYEYCTDSFAVFHSEDVAGESDINHAVLFPTFLGGRPRRHRS